MMSLELVDRSTRTREEFFEAAGQHEFVVHENEHAAKLGMDRDFGFLAFFQVGAQKLDEVAADYIFVWGHTSDGRSERVWKL